MFLKSYANCFISLGKDHFFRIYYKDSHQMLRKWAMKSIYSLQHCRILKQTSWSFIKNSLITTHTKLLRILKLKNMLKKFSWRRIFVLQKLSLIFMLALSSLSIGLHLPLGAQTVESLLDTPNGLSLERGEYSLETYLYGSGGLFLKFGVGINSYINLGLTEYIDQLIGTNQAKPSLPNAYLKIRIPFFLTKANSSLDLAFGFDALYKGSFSPFEKKSYGAFSVITIGFPMFENIFNSPHYFSVGLRMPLLFELAEPDLFASLHIRFIEFFELASEIQNIHFSKQYKYYFINNNIAMFRLPYGFSLDFTFQLAGEIIEESNKVKERYGFSMRLMFKDFF